MSVETERQTVTKPVDDSETTINSTDAAYASETEASDGQKEGQPQKSLDIEGSHEQPPTSYLETIVHLFKGNIGPGLFAMGDAFRHGGLVVSPILIVTIALISIHCQHVLIRCSEKMRKLRNDQVSSDYAQTVEHCFENGPMKLRSWSKIMKTIVNIFICVTQLGFCCIYFVFISTNMKQLLHAYGIIIEVHWMMVIAFVPILLTSLITNLKWLTPVSLIANICMISGLIITLYCALKDGVKAESIKERALYTNFPKLALFFGTAIFAYEGITLVLPLRNAMSVPHNFSRKLGVLNVGMFFVTVMFMFAGFVGYIKWGEHVGGSLTLNLGDTILAQIVKLMVSTGVLLGYPLQFFIAIQIMWPNTIDLFNIKKGHYIGELIFRTFMVLVTLSIAELVPALGLFMSLIGSFCSTALALVFPPMIQLLLQGDDNKGPSCWVLCKNIFILSLALLGFTSGTYESLSEIIRHFGEEEAL